MQIIQDFIPAGRRNRPGTKMTPLYITIHDTQNLKEGADAEAHARFLKGGAADVPASWHFTVDHDSIIQHLPLDEAAFHAGDGRNGPGNTTSLAVEITENPDGNRAKAEANAAELVASLLKQFNLGIDRVIQHNRWSGKDCPRVLRSRSGGWEGFIKAVQSYLEGDETMTEEVRQLLRTMNKSAFMLVDGMPVAEQLNYLKVCIDRYFANGGK